MVKGLSGKKSLFFVLLISFLISLASGAAFAASPQVGTGPTNPDFIKWQSGQLKGALGGEGRAGGYIPEPVDWSHLSNVTYRSPRLRAGAPAAYDLRNVNGANYVTSVKNQGQEGACWAFATLASLESTQLKAGSLIGGVNNDLSEKHLAWFTYRDGVMPHFTSSAADAGVLSTGGNFSQSSAILSRWTGPTDESSLTYEPTGTLPAQASDSYPRQLLVTDVYRLSIAELSVNSPSVTEFNEKRKQTYDSMKELITGYGALSISFCSQARNVSNVMNTATHAFYCKTNYGPDHAVTVVGWDDAFEAAKFGTPPPGPGAWLIKNSWGTSWEDGGYFWISYYDNTLSDVALFRGVEKNTYQKMYLHDPLAYVYALGYKNLDSVWAANIFTAAENGQINAVAFNTSYALLDYEVRVFTNVTDTTNPSSGTQQGNPAKSGSLTYAGYHTVILDSPIAIQSGEKFSVAIKIKRKNGESGAYFPYEGAMNNYTDAATANTGESFLSSYSGTGAPSSSSSWYDLTKSDSTGNFCIRALVNVASAPSITTTSLPGGTVGAAYSRPIDATGSAPITWAIDDGALPGGLTLNASTGTISGTPSAAGTFNFTVKATNSAGNNTKALSIVIAQAPTTSPTITTASLPDGTVGSAYSQTLTATGGAPSEWTIDNGALPGGLALNPSTGTISGTPSAAGTFSFTVKAANSAGINTKALSIVIAQAPLTPPTITTASLPGGTVGESYSETLLATSNETVTWAIDSGTLPAGLVLSSTGTISGTPSAAGTFSFTVKAANSAGSNTKALSIVIAQAPLTPPTITTASLPGGTVGSAYSQTLTAAGAPTITWTHEEGTLPVGLALNSSGTISGTPSAAGTFNFTVKATNNVGSVTKQLSIVIASASPAPVTPPAPDIPPTPVTPPVPPTPAPVGPTATIDGATVINVSSNGNTLTVTFSDNTTKTYNLSQTNVNVAYNDLSKFTVLKNDDNIFFTANSPLIPDGEVIRVAMKGKDSASAFEFNVTVATVANKTQFYIPWAALPDGTYDITFASPSGSNPYYSGVLAKDYVNKNSGVNPNPVDPGNEQTPSGGGSGGGCDAGFGAFALVLASGAAMALRKKK